MKRLFLIGLLLVATGCAAPRQTCELQATRDLRVVQSLIDDLEAIQRRGYELERQTTVRRRLTFCRNRDGVRRTCVRPTTSTRVVPRAVNLDTEREKLASLIAKRDELRARSSRALDACRATYPAQ